MVERDKNLYWLDMATNVVRHWNILYILHSISDGDPYGFRDTQKHIICCPGYAVLRQDKDLNNDKDLVTYFQQVIKHRQDSE